MSVRKIPISAECMPRVRIQMVVSHAHVTLDIRATLQELLAQVRNCICFHRHVCLVLYYFQQSDISMRAYFLLMCLDYYNCWKSTWQSEFHVLFMETFIIGDARICPTSFRTMNVFFCLSKFLVQLVDTVWIIVTDTLDCASHVRVICVFDCSQYFHFFGMAYLVENVSIRYMLGLLDPQYCPIYLNLERDPFSKQIICQNQCISIIEEDGEKVASSYSNFERQSDNIADCTFCI